MFARSIFAPERHILYGAGKENFIPGTTPRVSELQALSCGEHFLVLQRNKFVFEALAGSYISLSYLPAHCAFFFFLCPALLHTK